MTRRSITESGFLDMKPGCTSYALDFAISPPFRISAERFLDSYHREHTYMEIDPWPSPQFLVSVIIAHIHTAAQSVQLIDKDKKATRKYFSPIK